MPANSLNLENQHVKPHYVSSLQKNILGQRYAKTTA